MADDDLDQQPEAWAEIGKAIAAGFISQLPLDSIRDMNVGGDVQAHHGKLTSHLNLLEELGTLLGKVLITVEEPVMPLFAGFASTLVSNLFGTELSETAFHNRGNREQRKEGAAAVVQAYTNALYGDGDDGFDPSDKGAQRIATAAVHATIEGWFNGLVPDLLESLVPFDVGHIEDWGKLGEEVIAALGVGRLVRRAFTPLVNATAATPMQWLMNKTFQQSLLSESNAIQGFNMGLFSEEDLIEELARQGWSDKKISLLRLLHGKYITPDDALVLTRTGAVDRRYVVQALQNQGFDAGTAELQTTALETRRLESIHNDSLSRVKSAFVDRDIDEPLLDSHLGALVPNDAERTAHTVDAQIKRELNVKHMSQGEVLEALDHNILPVAFYRDWLAREGYPPDEATALELLYIAKRDAKADLAAERKRIADEKAKEQAARAAATQQRQTELDAERALRRRGSINDLRRAYARGLIPRDRLAEVLNAEYDADTVAIILADADVDRANYVAEQQKADDAKQRAARKQIDVGQLEQAVLTHVLTVADYGAALHARGFDDADTNILTRTLAAKLADQDAAAAQRKQAQAAAAIKHLDLNRLEDLVRRGLRSLADYDAQLQALGFDDAARAGMVDLLNAKVNDDAKAKALRDAAAAKAATKELSLEQFRRGVILGLRTETDFGAFLVKQGYTTDAQQVLVGELERDVADAESARAKRKAAESSAGAVDLPLSRATAAARLGVITPDAYRERLQRAGYSDDDIAIEMELLLVEIADTQAKRQRGTQLAQTTEPMKELTLSQLAQAVRAGVRPIEEYRAAASALYTQDDVETLVATLTAETQTAADARARHDAIAAELAARSLSLEDLEQQVKAGALSIAAYKAQLEAWGYAKDDQQLLAARLV